MAEDNLNNQEDKIDTGFRGVNARLDALVGHVTAVDGRIKGVDGRMHALEGRVEALDTGVNTRLDTLDTGFGGVSARLDTLDTGFRGVNARLDALVGHVTAVDGRVDEVRTDLGELKAHVFEIRDTLFADNATSREHVSIKVEALRSELKVYADGVIAHTGKLEDHETRIAKLEKP